MSLDPSRSAGNRSGRRGGALTLAVALVLASCSSGSKGESVSQEARRISADLYNKSGFPKGVPVPGILNGSVEIKIATVSGDHTESYNHPVILKQGRSKDLDGSWLGIPGDDAHDHARITPVKLELGKHGNTTESLSLSDPALPVLTGAAIYRTTVTNGPDAIMAFDITGSGNFPSVPVQSQGMK